MVDVVSVEPAYAGKNLREIRQRERDNLLREIPADYNNTQTGSVMYVSKDGTKHFINSASRPGSQRLENSSVEHMVAVKNAGKLLEGSVLGEVHENIDARAKFPVSRYYAIMKLNSEYYVVKFTSIVEEGKAAQKTHLESVDRVHDMYLTKKMPGSVKEAPRTLAKPSGRVQPAPGNNTVRHADGNINGHFTLYQVLEGLTDSVTKEAPLFQKKK